MGSRTWVMFTRKRQDMHSSCLANHVTPATPVTETKNCLYISHHTPLFGAFVGFPYAGWDLGPSALGINKLPSCLCITVVDLLSLSVGSEIRARSITVFPCIAILQWRCIAISLRPLDMWRVNIRLSMYGPLISRISLFSFLTSQPSIPTGMQSWSSKTMFPLFISILYHHL